MTTLNLNSLLELHGFDVPQKSSTKLTRHKISDPDLLEEFRYGDNRRFEIFQSGYSKPRYRMASHVISFLADGQTRALFKGIYRINGKPEFVKSPPEAREAFPKSKGNDGMRFWYDMTRLDTMTDLSNRLVVDWGKASSTLSWVQWLHRDKPKKIIEILPNAKARDFPGFDEVRLSWRELQEIVNNSDANRAWHHALKSVNGVYLILDTATGEHYVGAAYGTDGILGRWQNYAKTGDGGNKWLKGLDYTKFQYSILYICSASKTAKEVIPYEELFKRKLGTKAHGLNS
jgi:hypothetical protein